MVDTKPTVPSTTTDTGKVRSWLIFAALAVFAAIVFGILYFFVIAPSVPEGGQGYSVGWFLFSFAAGLTMIVLPCTLPLAFVIVPLSMGKGLVRGIGMAVAFGVGVATTLSMYGIVFAFVGGVLIDQAGTELEVIKNWVYFGAGIFALIFALSEIGLLKIHMPTYSGAAPAFIQKRSELIKAFLLGLFLGNIGVGCPHPATPLILIEIASSGDILYGWLMFLVHAVGRVLPLLLLSFLAILGVNGLNWLLARKDAIERGTGWAMVFVAGFILTLGLFSHDWWVNSGLHSGLETLTQEARFNVLINDTLGTAVEHVHGLEEGQGLFGLPLEWGNWFLVSVWLIPMWMWYRKRKREVHDGSNECDEKMLSVKRNFLIVIAIFIILVFTQLLPDNFYLKSTSEGGHDDEHAEEGQMQDDGMMIGMDIEGTPFLSSTDGLPEATESEFVNLKDGDTYDITAGYVKKEVGNRTLRMLAYNGSVPGPFIKAEQGTEVTINFTNNTDLDQTIHSHGLRLDNNSDGVPGVTQNAVAPGDSFTYTLKFVDAGVYWYHPHTRDDYGQEMGLYGNYLVDPISGYSSEVNREIPLIIDDILIENDKIVDFYREFTDFALLGRFGNEFLVNGETDYSIDIKRGEVIRFFVTDVSNARTYNLSIPGAEMKLVGADVGQYERESFVDNFLISPAERMIIEVYFENSGTYELTNTMPDGEIVLMRFEVLDEEVLQSYVSDFEVAHSNDSVISEFSSFRDELNSEPDKRMLLTVMIMGEVSHDDHSGHEVEDGETTEVTSGIDGIQWDDREASDSVNTSQNVMWMLVDEDTKKVSMDIDDWTFTEGELVKIRITNESEADHVMQHPIHLHGQQFVVLSSNDVPNDNMAWKDTVLVLPGESVDILVDMSNTGEWMAHCHISEHLHAGMMMQFRVQDAAGNASGDEYRSTLLESNEDEGHMHDDGVTQDHDEASEVETKKSSRAFTFQTSVPKLGYQVVVDIKRFKVGQKSQITLKLFNPDQNGVILSDSHPNPLGITFVKSNDSQSIYTYPGSLEFEDIEVHDEPNHDNSDGHHGFRLIPRALAHGGVDDGHTDSTGRVYEYTLPIGFSERGFYRAFVEFVPEGMTEPIVLSFDVEVASQNFSIDDFGWSDELQWWILLLASLAIMTPLIWFVRKFVNVKNV